MNIKGVNLTGVSITTFNGIGITTSTTTPTINGTVATGTTYGSPFSNTVNSYQIASQPGGSPYNYVSVPGSSGFAFGTGNYTVEWFQYITASTGFPRLFWYGSSPTWGFDIEFPTFYIWNGASFGNMGSVGTVVNTWVHFAVVRNGTSLTVYQNGSALSTGHTDSTNYTDTTSTLYIGSKANSGNTNEQFTGGLTSIRICKGVAVYTGNFTVPTSQLGQTQLANPYGGANTNAITAGQCSLLLNP